MNTGGFTGTIGHTPEKLVLSRSSGFRGDSRWTGMTVVTGGTSECVIACNEDGFVFIADDCSLLCGSQAPAAAARHGDA